MDRQNKNENKMKMLIEVLQQMKPVLYNLVGLCAIAVERKDTKVHNVLRRILGPRINGQSEKQSHICKQKPIMMMMRVLDLIKQMRQTEVPKEQVGVVYK